MKIQVYLYTAVCSLAAARRESPEPNGHEWRPAGHTDSQSYLSYCILRDI